MWFEDTSSVYEAQATDSAGTKKDGVKLTAVATAPRFLWTTPWTFLGATEMAFVIAPIVNLDVSNFPGAPGVSGHSLAFANPEFTPINLSWNLGVPELFGSVTFGFTGTWTASDAPPGPATLTSPQFFLGFCG